MHVRKLANCFLFFIRKRYNTCRRYIKGIILLDDSKPFHISKNKIVSSWTLQNFFLSIFSFMSLFFFDSPIFIGTICSHESIVISHYILYASHLYAIAILGMFPAYGSKKFDQYFITALVFCCYWSYCVTQIPSLSFNVSEISNMHTMI